MCMKNRSLLAELRRELGYRRCLVLAVCVALGLSIGFGRPAMADDRTRVFATVVPLAYFAQQIGGDRAQVQTLVRPGQDPHTYDPTPRQVAALADADLFIRVGMPLEDAWLPRIRATNPGLEIIDVREGLELRKNGPTVELAEALTGGTHESHEHEDHDPDGQDVHVWTSPLLAKAMSARIRDALVNIAPADAAAFQSGYERFAAALDALDARLRSQLAPLKQRSFMVFHPAWGYFADTYGLTQLAVEYQGKEPGARALARLIDLARERGIRVVVTQPQMSARSAERIASAIGGRAESVDPLSANYAATLMRLASLLAESQPR